MSLNTTRIDQSTFTSFWAHYHVAERWRRKHSEMVKESYLFVKNLSTTSKGIEENGSNAVIDEQNVVEIDAEYAAFKLITEEHKKKHSAPKSEVSGNVDNCWIAKSEDYILADRIGVNGILHKTIEEPDEKTKTVLKRRIACEKYGKAAEKLMAMETALDVHFNEYMNKQQLPMWPNIPLHF